MESIRRWCDKVLILIYQLVCKPFGTRLLYPTELFILHSQCPLFRSLRTALSAQEFKGNAGLSQDPLFTQYSSHSTSPGSPMSCFVQRRHVSCSGFSYRKIKSCFFRCQLGDGGGARQLQRLWANGWRHSRKPLGPHVLVNAFVKLGCRF